MSRPSGLVAFGLAALAAVPLGAIMMMPVVRKVPVDRLVANLERIAREQPRSAQAQINLARLHVMAYATNADELDAVESRAAKDKLPVEIPYYYGDGSTVPRDAAAGKRSAKPTARAVGHLKQAVRHYDAALKLEPDTITATLGRGWAREQLGDRAGAIADYRHTIEIAWIADSRMKMLMPSQRFVTQEAIGYLLPLLDAKRDAAEIQDLRSKQTDLTSRPRAITPIAVPLDDDATVAAIVDRRARVRFDADGSALEREWTWITPRAGWLVYDSDDSGEITSALQLFGNVSFWLFWANGYQALAALDDDGDETLAGRELRHLAIWRDADADGRSDRGEVRPLAEHGIRALSFDWVDGTTADVAAVAPRGVTLLDGRTRPTYDVILHHSAATLTRR